MFNFVVLGEPQGKERPRFTTIGNYARAYTPQKTVNYEQMVKDAYISQYGSDNKYSNGEALVLNVIAYYAIPKSASKMLKAKIYNGDIRPIKKPDIDNIIKIIADSLNGLAYKDDAQIVDISACKYYSNTPRVEVGIYEHRED